MQALSHQEIQRVAPAAFTNERAEHLSDRYNFIRTADVLSTLESEGFFPVQASQDNARLRDPRYVRHSIVLRPEEYDAAEGEVAPQILMVNSHNGRTKLRLFAGFYRFICCNGLVVGEDKYTVEIAHHTSIEAGVQEYLRNFTDSVADLNLTMRRWSDIELNRHAQYEFARRAMELRFGSEQAKAYDLDSVLEAKREEDEGRTLWRVYNNVQEHATKGGIKGKSATGRELTSRALTGIGSDLDFNRNLWALAESVAQSA